MWPYPWTHVGTPSHLGHMDRVAATMPSQAHAGAAQEAPDIGQWEGQDVPLVRPSSCNVKGGIPSSRRYLPTYLPTQPRESENANTGRTPTEGSKPASNALLLQTPCPATSSPTQANETTKGRTRPQPTRKSSDLPIPRIPPDPPGEPRPSILVILPPTNTTAPPGPSILVILPPTSTTAPPGPGILIILPPATSTAPARSVPRVRKRCEGPTALPQRPHRRLDLV